MKVTIAAAQMKIFPTQIEKNLDKAKKFVELAANKNADIIAFPELFITGASGSNVALFADTIPGRFSNIFSKLSEEHGIYIVMGSIYEKDNGKYYNSSVVIDDNGSIVGVYRKNKLWITEKKVLSASSDRPVFDTKFGKIGVMICWDLAFPEVARSLAKKGAKIIFAPVNWSVEDFTRPPYNEQVLREKSNLYIERTFVNTLTAARAMENNVYVVLINGFGDFETKTGKRTFIGLTQITSPFYGQLFKANKEELLIGEIETQITEIAEQKYKLIADSD